MSLLSFGKSSQDKILIKCLSSMALAIIGDGWRIEDDFASSVFYDSHLMDFFNTLEEISSELDDSFITPMKRLPLTGNQYMTLMYHFASFKQVNLNPLFGTLINDTKLRNSVYKEVMWKLTQDLSISETRRWRDYHNGILDMLGLVISKLTNSFYDYEKDISTVFAASAVKLNPTDLTWNDCSSFTNDVFSKPLITILGTHYTQLEIMYKSFLGR